MPLDNAERQSLHRARQKGKTAAEEGLWFPGTPVGGDDYFTPEQSAMRAGYADTIWALHSASPMQRLSDEVAAEFKASKKEVAGLRK